MEIERCRSVGGNLPTGASRQLGGKLERMEGPQPVYGLECFRGITGLALACSTEDWRLWDVISCRADAGFVNNHCFSANLNIFFCVGLMF